MKEAPFSPEIQEFKKPLEVGDTNKIYYDPEHPDVLIRVPTDHESRFLETDPKLIGVAEKMYRRLGEMGRGLDIDVAEHQFILAKETVDGPIKPMLLAKRIEGGHLVPIDKNNPRTLEALSRIAELGFKYLNWIKANQPKSVITDIFKPVQYIVQPGEAHDKLTLVDIEPRLAKSDKGIKSIDHALGMLVGPLRDSAYNDTFRRFLHHGLKSLKRDRAYSEMAGLIGSIINAPDIYQMMYEDFLDDRELRVPPKEALEWARNTPLTISRELLKKFGIDKI